VRKPLLALVLTLTPAPLLAQGSPQALAAEAVTAAGGRSALAQARALTWTGEATVHLPGRDIHLAGTWRILPPDSALVTTYEVEKGPSTARTLVLAGTRAWLRRDTTMAPLPASFVAEERHQFYLYSLLRVLPLLDDATRLTALAADSTGLRGLRVERPGRLPVDLYFTADGLISRIHTTFATESGAPGESQEITLDGSLWADGIRWFRRMDIRRAGQPYFELEVQSLTTDSTLADPLLAGPGKP